MLFKKEESSTGEIRKEFSGFKQVDHRISGAERNTLIVNIVVEERADSRIVVRRIGFHWVSPFTGSG